MALSASYRRLLYEIRGIFHHTIHTRHRTLVQLGQLRFTGVIVKCCESSMTISATFSSKHMRLKPIPRRLGHGNVIIALSFSTHRRTIFPPVSHVIWPRDCLEKGHYSRRMATYCGHSNAPAEYALKEEEVASLIARCRRHRHEFSLRRRHFYRVNFALTEAD